MSVIAHEGINSFHFGARAILLSDDLDHETASEWASGHMQKNPAYSWILGKFVEAERPNNNKQFFSTAGLQMGRPSIMHAPMNINHHQNRVVGTFVAAELLFPKEETAMGTYPHIESLAAFWKYYYPDEYNMVKAAQNDGSLFFSMECVPRAISTVGGSDDTMEYKYEGRTSPNYPKEINERSVDGINLIDPHFVGGALVIPPEKPGWSRAEVTQMSSLVADRTEDVAAAYDLVKDESPHLSEATIEWVAFTLAKVDHFSDQKILAATQRKVIAAAGMAMPDGSFPILNVDDLRNAVQFVDKALDVDAAKKFIVDRASKLDASDVIPSEWNKN